MPNKFKIAIQLFGHLRTYEECSENLKNYLLDLYDCDVFMHTWDTLDHSTKTWHSFKVKSSVKVNEIRDNLIKLYNLKDLKIETQNFYPDMGTFRAIDSEISVSGIKYMFYSMRTVNELREKYQVEHNIKYDFVLTLRPDVYLKEKFEIEYFLQRMTIDEINHGFFTYFFPMVGIYNDLKKLGMTDILFFGVPSLISNVISNLSSTENLFKNGISFNFGPEFLFLKGIVSLNYKVYLIRYNNNDESTIRRKNIIPILDNRSNNKLKLIRLKINKKEFQVLIMKNLFITILSIKFCLFNKYKIYLCIGKKDD